MNNENLNSKQHEIDENVLYNFSLFMKVFSDITRVKIVYCLLNGELKVQDISHIVGTTQSATSHQLSFLKNMRIVKPRKSGKNVYYSLMDEHIASIMSIGIEHVLEKQ